MNNKRVLLTAASALSEREHLTKQQLYYAQLK